MGLLAGLLIVLRASAEPSVPTGSISINTLEDELNNDGDCSLREAIHAANDNAEVDTCPAGQSDSKDTITFNVSGTITLTDQLSITLGGPLIINGGGAITVSGNYSVRVFRVMSGAKLTLVNLTVAKGYTEYENGGAIYNQGELTATNSTLINNQAFLGGGIYNQGVLVMNESDFSGNIAVWNGGGVNNVGRFDIRSSNLGSNIARMSGGGITNVGAMTITESSLHGNTAAYVGGGIYNYYGEATLSNSTLSDNIAEYGGGISTVGALTLTNSTVVNNDAVEGGGLYNGGDVLTAENSILANNTGGNCWGPISDGGHNVEDTDTCNLSTLKGSMPDTDPLLGPLQDNGGSTWTHAPLIGSPVVDSAEPGACPAADQRNAPRPVDGDGDGDAVCDIGSVELVPAYATVISDDPDPSQAGQPITVTLAVTSTWGSPSGKMTVNASGSGEQCAGVIVDGTGGCALALTTPGAYTLTVNYMSDSFFSNSSDTEPHEVAPAETTTTISSDEPDPSSVNQPFTVSFGVSSPFGIPEGQVNITVIEGNESCLSDLVDGFGDCTMTLSSLGEYTLNVEYLGNQRYEASSAAELHTVKSLEVFLPLVAR
jgi:CSLREA domain-containing protein